MSAASEAPERPASASEGASAPRTGRLHERPLPQLLIDLYAERFSGALRLQRERSEKQVLFFDGAPVAAESSHTSESLCAFLRDRGALGQAESEQVARTLEQRKCAEAAALLALKLVEPKVLFQAIRAQLRARLLDCFAWDDGEYRLDGDCVPGEDVKPFRCNPLRLAAEGLASRWGLDRLAPALQARLAHFPSQRPRLERLRRHLPESDALDAALGACDGTRPLGQALGAAAASPEVLAGFWVLAGCGAFDWSDEPRSPTRDDTAAAEIEIEVTGAAAAKASPGSATAARPSSRPRSAEVGGEAEKLRHEIESLHAQLEEKSYFELLGIERDTAAAGVKKAYFKAAKRFHPDALGRVGLDDLKQAAGEIFARIGEAHGVLTDPERRRNYEAELAGEALGIDAEQLARAEALFRKGEVLSRMGDFRGALEFLAPAVELWPDEGAYQAALGWALHKKSPPETERALEHLQRALELAPEDAVVHLRLGTVLRANGQAEKAAAHLALAKRLDPTVR